MGDIGPLHFSQPVPAAFKSACQAMVVEALESGALIRQPCESCGTTGDDVLAHHDDYGRPLDVRWLCRSHHAERHLSLGHPTSWPGGPRIRPTKGATKSAHGGHGGHRKGAGRPRSTNRSKQYGGQSVFVRLSADELASLEAALENGETVASLLRDQGLAEVKRRERAKEGDS